MKVIKPIRWKTWSPQVPSDFPCMLCKNEATLQVQICDLYNLLLCEKCALIPEYDLERVLIRVKL